MTKNFINVLKVLAMLFVVCMHVISKALPNYAVGTSTYNVLICLDILLRSSVPIFVLISGYLILNRKYTIKEVIFKLIKYYIVFVIFNSMYMVLDRVIINKVDFSPDLLRSIFIDSLLVKTIYQMWYFKIIFLTYAFIPLFQYIISKKSFIIDTITLGILILLFQVIPWFIPVFYANYTYLLVFLTYFYLGYYLMKYTFKGENIILFIFFLISYIYVYNKTVVLDHDYYYLNFILFNTMFIAIFIFKVSKELERFLTNKTFNKIIKYLSSLNFPVFLFHGLIIGGLSYTKVINIYTYDNLFMILVNTLIVYGFSLLIGYLYNGLFHIVKK